jgi:hypothetical protein
VSNASNKFVNGASGLLSLPIAVRSDAGHLILSLLSRNIHARARRRHHCRRLGPEREQSLSKNVGEDGRWTAEEIDARWAELTDGVETMRMDSGY